MKLISKLKNNSFKKNILILVSGTAFAQFLNIILSPLITRIYTPEEFGAVVLFTAIIGILSIISSLKYEHAIVLASNDKLARNIVVLCLIVLSIFVSMVVMVIVIMETLNINYGVSLKIAMFIPIAIFLIGTYQILIQWEIRHRNFKIISKTRVNQSVSANFGKIILGVFNFGSLGLVFSVIIGNMVGIKTLIKSLNVFETLKNVKKKYLVVTLKRYKNFALYFTPSQLFNASGTHLPIILLSFMYGVKFIGIYGLANTILNLPVTVVGNAVGEVFYSEAAKIAKSNPRKLQRLSLVLLRKLFLIGIVPFIILVAFSPQLFTVVFGKDWSEVGELSRILAILVFFKLLFIPVSRVFEVFEKQKEALILDIFRLVLVMVVFGSCYVMESEYYFTVFLYTIAMSIVYLITFAYAQVLMKKQIKLVEIIQ